MKSFSIFVSDLILIEFNLGKIEKGLFGYTDKLIKF